MYFPFIPIFTLFNFFSSFEKDEKKNVLLKSERVQHGYLSETNGLQQIAFSPLHDGVCQSPGGGGVAMEHWEKKTYFICNLLSAIITTMRQYSCAFSTIADCYSRLDTRSIREYTYNYQYSRTENKILFFCFPYTVLHAVQRAILSRRTDIFEKVIFF